MNFSANHGSFGAREIFGTLSRRAGFIRPLIASPISNGSKRHKRR